MRSILRRNLLLPLGGAVLVFAAHEAWYRSFPQVDSYPPDQSAYLAGGRAIFAVLPALSVGAFSDPAVELARRWLDFLGVSFFYGLVDAIRPDDLPFLRKILALLNTLAALGAHRLACQLGGRGAGAATLLFFIVSPAFPSGASRLYPDGLTGALMVWGLSLLLGRPGRLASLAGGALLAGAMVVRIQLVPWLPALMILAIAVTFPRWRGIADQRMLVKWGTTGFLTVAIPFAAVTSLALENQDPRSPKHNLPKYQRYAAGVWQFLDTDGWDGPYRLTQEPFYQAMEAASRKEPALMTSRPRQYVFALGYLWQRRAESVPLILDNLFRLSSRPQNPEHRSLFGSETFPLLIHRLSILAAVAGGVVACSRNGFFFLAALIPLFVLCIHAFAFPWLRYSMPVLPLILALAGVGATTLFDAMKRGVQRALLPLGILLLLVAISRVMAEPRPQMSRALGVSVFVFGLMALSRLAVPLHAGPGLRAFMTSAFAAVSLVVAAHEWRSTAWHERRLVLRDGEFLRQEIILGPASIKQLRGQEERFLAIDAEISEPGAVPWRLRINGLEAVLAPTIPLLPEAIPVSEERWTYPQWWLAPLTDQVMDAIERDGRLKAEIEILRSDHLVIKGDRFDGQDGLLEAPSFGEWPYAVETKPEYDRDYRLVVRRPLVRGATRTTIAKGAASRESRITARVRIVALENMAGRVLFEAKGDQRRRSPGPQTLVFNAQSGITERADGEVRLNGEPIIRFPIGRFRDYTVASGVWALCYVDRTPNPSQASEGRGSYVLKGPPTCTADQCQIEIRFWPGLDRRRLFFRTEALRNQPGEAEITSLVTQCGFDPEAPIWRFGRLLDGTANSYPEDRGRWAVALTF